MNSDFINELKNYKTLTEDRLSYIFKNIKCEGQNNVVEAMSYSVLNGGKRIRSFLTLETCRAMGGNIEHAILTACAIEMVHAYSLIHDDLPAMDDDDLRRGMPSCHKKFGEALAILAGDGLQTLAFEILSSKENTDKIGFENALKCIRVVSNCIGESGMLGGQVVDVLNENKILSQHEHLNMVSMKTGALLKASVHCGLICSNTERDNLKNALEFADALGIAFQIKDDILDATGNVKQLGKAVGSDEKRQKNTFVSIYGLERTIELSKIYHEKALKALKRMNCEKELLQSATHFLAKRNF